MSHLPAPLASQTAIVGAILAGGQSLRMGTDKSRILWRQRRLLEWVLARLQAQVPAVFISLPYGGQVFADLVLPQKTDLQPQLGPLAGVREALVWAQQQGATWLLTSSCDTPLLPLNLAARLQTAANAAITDVCYAHYQGRDHYLHCLWSPRVLPALDAYLAAGGRSVKGFFARVQSTRADFFDPSKAANGDPFFNINTRADLQRLQTLLPSADDQTL